MKQLVPCGILCLVLLCLVSCGGGSPSSPSQEAVSQEQRVQEPQPQEQPEPQWETFLVERKQQGISPATIAALLAEGNSQQQLLGMDAPALLALIEQSSSMSAFHRAQLILDQSDVWNMGAPTEPDYLYQAINAVIHIEQVEAFLRQVEQKESGEVWVATPWMIPTVTRLFYTPQSGVAFSYYSTREPTLEDVVSYPVSRIYDCEFFYFFAVEGGRGLAIHKRPVAGDVAVPIEGYLPETNLPGATITVDKAKEIAATVEQDLRNREAAVLEGGGYGRVILQPFALHPQPEQGDELTVNGAATIDNQRYYEVEILNLQGGKYVSFYIGSEEGHPILECSALGGELMQVAYAQHVNRIYELGQ